MFLLFLAIITLYLLRKANKYLNLKKNKTVSRHECLGLVQIHIEVGSVSCQVQ